MSTPAAHNEDYNTLEYWEQRYQEESEAKVPNYTFDWFKSYRDIRGLIYELIPDKNAKILMLGCGNSGLSQDMYADGYINIVNIDYSTTVIRMMSKRHQAECPLMQWHIMDVRDLKLEDETFDVVLDKGTMDAILALPPEQSVWHPPQEAIDGSLKEVSEAIRVLKSPNGLFLYLTFSGPHFRKQYMDPEAHPQFESSLEVRVLGGEDDSFHYFGYIVRKTGPRKQ